MSKYNATTGEFDFGIALDSLRDGRRVARRAWPRRGMWVELQRPDGSSKMTQPYIYLHTVDGDLVPWFASQTDLLAQDWMEAA